MNPKVTILEAEPKTKSGEFDGRDGEKIAYTTIKQKAKVETSDGFAYPYEVRLEEGVRPHPLGEYELDLGAMLVVKNGAHSLSKYSVLRPLPKK